MEKKSMWKKKWSERTPQEKQRTIIIVIPILIVIFIIFGTSRDDSYESEYVKPKPKEITPLNIGDVSQGQYFEWAVTDVRYEHVLDTGVKYKEWNPKPEDSTNFLSVKWAIKNIDTKAHRVENGQVEIVSDGKTYVYDKVEMLTIVDGWGSISYETIGPLITLENWQVFRIPKDLSGKVFFNPTKEATFKKKVYLGYIEDGQIIQSPDGKKDPSNVSNEKISNDKIYKINDMILGLKYLSNPFDIRQRLLGKTIETRMGVFKFIDEGNQARLIGDGSGVACLMSPEEFSKNRSKGVKVVRGTLVEWSGGLSLDNCIYISDDINWKATDDIDDIR